MHSRPQKIGLYKEGDKWQACGERIMEIGQIGVANMARFTTELVPSADSWTTKREHQMHHIIQSVIFNFLTFSSSFNFHPSWVYFQFPVSLFI